MKRLLRFLMPAIAIIACVANAQEGLSPEYQKKMLASFDVVWSTVKKRHYDPKLGGVNWKKARKQFRPLVKKAKSEEEGRKLMNDMLGLLHQSHLAVLPASGFSSANNYSPGIDLRILGNQAIVTHVEANSPAAEAGVASGWEIIKIDGKDVAPIISNFEKQNENSTRKASNCARAILGMTKGKSDIPIEIEFHDGTDTTIIKLNRIELRGRQDGTIKNLPSSMRYFWVDTTKTTDDIIIIKFNVWLNSKEITKTFTEIMAEGDKAKGYIIDLRGNPGGDSVIAGNVAGWFIKEKDLSLGQRVVRSGRAYLLPIAPRLETTDAPLAILVDCCSASTSEIFAGVMQELGRAKIFGSNTGGAVLNSMFIRLPNGDGFQYAQGLYISPSGKRLEGVGVSPDIMVAPTRNELLAGEDPAMEKAIAWIMESSPEKL
jgi:carboxyl-terminal processing protease